MSSKTIIERIHDYLSAHSGEVVTLSEMGKKLGLTDSQMKSGINNFRNSALCEYGTLEKLEMPGQYRWTSGKEQMQEETEEEFDPIHSAFAEGQEKVHVVMKHIGHDDDGYCMYKIVSDQDGTEAIVTMSSL